jgi:hypothetical protein
MTMITRSIARICCAFAVTVLLLPAAVPAWSADNGEVDPASVSDGLKATFSYGKGTKAIKDRLNANTVTVSVWSPCVRALVASPQKGEVELAPPPSENG